MLAHDMKKASLKSPGSLEYS